MHAHQNVCGSRIHHLGFPLSYVSVTLAPLHHRSLSHPQTVAFSTTLAMSTLVTSIYLLALLAEKRDVKVHTSSTNSEAQNSNRFHESFNVLVENLLSIFANIIPVCVGQNKEKTHLLPPSRTKLLQFTQDFGKWNLRLEWRQPQPLLGKWNSLCSVKYWKAEI